jgi:hypothetical protein
MEALEMLKFSIKQGRGMNFTEGTSMEARLTHLEAETERNGLVPEDPASYIYFVQGLLLRCNPN